MHIDILACFNKEETRFIVGEEVFIVEGNKCSVRREQDDNGIEYFAKLDSIQAMIIEMELAAKAQNALMNYFNEN